MSETSKSGLGNTVSDKASRGVAVGKLRSEPVSIKLTVNGQFCTITVEPLMTLLDALPKS